LRTKLLTQFTIAELPINPNILLKFVTRNVITPYIMFIARRQRIENNNIKVRNVRDPHPRMNSNWIHTNKTVTVTSNLQSISLLSLRISDCSFEGLFVIKEQVFQAELLLRRYVNNSGTVPEYDLVFVATWNYERSWGGRSAWDFGYVSKVKSESRYK
jgi:hypothetical protein